MTFDFSITKLNYQDSIKKLDAYAHGKVKSKKDFPVFRIHNQEYIFKPLSKTKPLSTPYFAYSEVFWSTIINHYFDPTTPIYKLAIIDNYGKDYKNKYHHGTIVPSLEKPEYKILNLYEVFLKYKDNTMTEEEYKDIKDYQNFCEKFYDFTRILYLQILNDDKKLGEQLAYQILLSILRLDQNYHYENPLFYTQNDQLISITPPIDHEFSTMFLYADELNINLERYKKALKDITWTIDENDIFSIYRYQAFAIINQNIKKIAQKYPHICECFLKNLKTLITDLEAQEIKLQDYGYLTPFNSCNFMVGCARFKQNNETLAHKLEAEMEYHNPNIDDVSKIVYEETLGSSKILKKALEKELQH